MWFLVNLQGFEGDKQAWLKVYGCLWVYVVIEFIQSSNKPFAVFANEVQALYGFKGCGGGING